MKTIEILKAEHDDILLMLDVLERMSEKIVSSESVPLDHVKLVLNFLENFADKYHNSKEEEFLFVEMRNAGVPEIEDLLAVVLSEHRRGRRFIGDMKDLLASHEKGQLGAVMVFTTPALQYVDLYKSNIWKENTALFTMAENTLPADKFRLLAERFEAFNAEFGRDARDTFYETVRELWRIYLG